MSQYSFVTHWKFKAPIDKVWSEIREMNNWPEWWKYVKSVTLIKLGDAMISAASGASSGARHYPTPFPLIPN